MPHLSPASAFIRRNGLRLLTFLLLAPLSPAPVRAQSVPAPAPQSSPAPAAKSKSTAKPAPAVRQLPTIVVTAATRNTQSIDTTATSSTVLTREDLDRNQYVSVAQALQTVPGVAVVPSGVPGQITSVFIRGGDSDQTLLTIDGRRQPVGLDGATDFTNLTLDDIDRIEIVRTPSSSLQGGNSAGGVINLVTLTGRGLAQPESSVAFEGGSFGTTREIAQSRGAEGNFDYAVSASNEDADMNRDNENYRNAVYRGNFGYQITPAVYFNVHTGYSLADAGSPNTIETPDPIARLITEDWFISPEVTAKVSGFYTTTLYYDHDQQREVDHDLYTSPDGFSILPVSTRLQINTDSADWQNTLQLARHWQIIAGVQMENTDVYQFAETDDFAFPPVIGARELENGLFNIGGYAESQWQPVDGLNVLSSVREDQYSDYDGAFSWRQGVSYRVPQTQTLLHASGASAYTPPSLQDLYYPGFSNPNLKPETSLGWEAGVAQPLLGGRVTPSATYFHNDITNYIQFAGAAPENIASATTDGVELDVQAKPIDPLSLDLNYTYLNAVNNDSVTQPRLLRRPRNTLNFTAVWTPLPPLTLSLGGSWIVGRQDYNPAVFADTPAPDYFVLRASATYRLDQYVTLWVRGENLTDQYYEPVLGYPALGLGAYAGIKISF